GGTAGRSLRPRFPARARRAAPEDRRGVQEEARASPGAHERAERAPRGTQPVPALERRRRGLGVLGAERPRGDRVPPFGDLRARGPVPEHFRLAAALAAAAAPPQPRRALP